MTDTTKTGPKDVFLHVLAFGALYVSIISFINLVFGYINYSFPDPLFFYETGVLNSIRTATSILIVIFPVFLVVSYLLEKDFNKNPGKRESKFRKWLIYFTLFLAAVTVIVDLITLINRFYAGELTVQFLLKTLTVLGVAGTVFLYYKWDLDRQSKSLKAKQTAWIVSVIILIAIIAGFFVVGSPAEQREKRLDFQRISDLSVIQNQIVNYWDARDRLPSSLDELEEYVGFMPTDPETKEDYGYRVLGARSFELCAVFGSESVRSNERGVNLRQPIPSIVKGVLVGQNWDHSEGLACFEREITFE